jgi:hypothetical protein
MLRDARVQVSLSNLYRGMVMRLWRTPPFEFSALHLGLGLGEVSFLDAVQYAMLVGGAQLGTLDRFGCFAMLRSIVLHSKLDGSMWRAAFHTIRMPQHTSWIEVTWWKIWARREKFSLSRVFVVCDDVGWRVKLSMWLGMPLSKFC